MILSSKMQGLNYGAPLQTWLNLSNKQSIYILRTDSRGAESIQLKSGKEPFQCTEYRHQEVQFPLLGTQRIVGQKVSTAS